MIKLALLSLIILLIPGIVMAAIIHVPGDYPTIQAGIDAAADGDTVQVASGTYMENLTWPETPELTLMSSGAAESTIIDGAELHSVITITSPVSNDINIRDMTIQNGLHDNGGGIYATNVNLHLDRCIIAYNKADQEYPLGHGEGGGIYALDSYLWLADCQFLNNTAGSSEWMSDGSIGGAIAYGTIFAQNCVFKGNGVEGTHSYGGAIGYAQLQLHGCLITENYAIGGPPNGGISGCEGYIELSTIYDNEYWDIHVWSSDSLSVDSCIIGTIDGGVDMEHSCYQDDPLFISGPLGDHYLSQIASGQDEDSPCLDSGNPELPINGTTRTDHVPDSGVVDTGFHYLADYIPYTATPIPTETPEPATQTPAPTSTPDNECNKLGVKLWMPSDHYQTDDDFSLTVTVCNPDAETYHNIPFFVIVDVMGSYWFWPTFTQEIAYLTIELKPGLQEHAVISVRWPEGAGTGSGTFYAAMTDESFSALFGDWDSWEFGWI